MAEDQLYNARLYDVAKTGVGTSSGVSVTFTGVTSEKCVVTSIAASGDAAALVTIESPASTVLWQLRFAAAFTFTKDWTHPTITGASGSDVVVKISASTSHCEANLNGFTVKG